MPTDPELLDLLEVIDGGIHDPSWMPFRQSWTDVPQPQRNRDSLAHWWRLRALWSPDHWSWCGAVRYDGELVGVQDLMAQDFAVLREVTSGSWLGRAHQGVGIGKEMRAAILHLAFVGLGATRAHSGFVEGNEPSRKVSESLGYVSNGCSYFEVRGHVRRELHVVLERDVWELGRRDDIEIDGLEECLELFGVEPVSDP
jgi:RimJ/RimL family protein N-acetyltransferase